VDSNVTETIWTVKLQTPIELEGAQQNLELQIAHQVAYESYKNYMDATRTKTSWTQQLQRAFGH
jgi:hypothetical protein